MASDSNAIVAYFTSHHWTFPADSSGALALFATAGSRPVYWSTSSDPLVKVLCRGSVSCRHRFELHVPAGAQAQDASDGHMTVVDQSLHREFDFWRARPSEHGEMSVAAQSSIPIGAGVGSGRYGDAEAAYLGLLGGLLRAPELVAGRIEHALAITAPCVQYRDVWPSPAYGRGDLLCGERGAGPHLGSRLQLDMSAAEIAATGAPPWQQAIMTAMARYGLFVVDTNGPHDGPVMWLLQEDDRSFTSFGYPGEMQRFISSLGGGDRLVGVPIDVSKLRVIAP